MASDIKTKTFVHYGAGDAANGVIGFKNINGDSRLSKEVSGCQSSRASTNDSNLQLGRLQEEDVGLLGEV
jgi:hypothetical protein